MPDRATTARRKDVALAGHSGDTAGVRVGLTDRAALVRATALGALARLGQLDGEFLAAAFSDRDPVVRRRAAELAPNVGPSMLAQLSSLLGDGDHRVVEAACFALGELGEKAALGVAALSRVAVDHPDPLCRETAVAALGAIGDPEGLAAILMATADKPAVRRRAVLALAPFEGEAVDAALARALTDRDWQVRQAAEDLTT
ncbi:MAG: HEAT repeat domain-containing protein [Actinomycetota bacterium]|nr:HEAT repeat domain-containing protein [Actinomycetota bacterium]